MKSDGKNVTFVNDIHASTKIGRDSAEWEKLYGRGWFLKGVSQSGWTPTANLAWLDGMVRSRKPLVISEPLEKLRYRTKSDGSTTESFTALEVKWMQDHGWKWDPNYTGPGAGRLMPPPKLDPNLEHNSALLGWFGGQQDRVTNQSENR